MLFIRYARTCLLQYLCLISLHYHIQNFFTYIQHTKYIQKIDKPYLLCNIYKYNVYVDKISYRAQSSSEARSKPTVMPGI